MNSRAVSFFNRPVLLLAVAGFALPLRAETSAPVEDQAQVPAVQLPPEAKPSLWSFTFEPYVWALGLSGDLGVHGFGPVKVDFTPDTILRHLDWNVMARAEIRRGRFGVIGDGYFAQLSASGDPPLPFYQSARVEIQQGMASLAVFYRLLDYRQGYLDLYAGARFNYLRMNLGGDPDSDGIQNASEVIVERVGSAIARRTASYLAANAAAIESQVVQVVGAALSDKALAAQASIREVVQSLRPSDITRIMRQLKNSNGAYRELVAATVAVQVAETKNQVSSATRQRLKNAQKKFAKALAKKIEDTLPTGFDGEQGWVDPIVGLRGQVNFTRWLFLAVQGDVGGFGVASDIAWMAQASLGVNITRNLFAEAGYRYFYMDYENGGFSYQAAEYGLFTGIGVRF